MLAPSYGLETVAAPAAVPVTTAEAKAHLRVLHASEDALIDRLVKVAVAHVENVIGRALITRTLRMRFDRFTAFGGPLKLLRPPLIAITEFSYVDAAGDEAELEADDYQIARSAISAELSPPTGSLWPTTHGSRRSVSITFTAGYGAASTDVPEDIRNAILLLVEHFYYHRSAVSETGLIETPMAVGALLGPHMTTGWI